MTRRPDEVDDDRLRERRDDRFRWAERERHALGEIPGARAPQPLESRMNRSRFRRLAVVPRPDGWRLDVGLVRRDDSPPILSLGARSPEGRLCSRLEVTPSEVETVRDALDALLAEAAR